MPEQRELLTRFQVSKFIGKGSFGSVFRVQRLSDGGVYALKETNVRHMNQAERQEAVNEIRLLASVSNPGVVTYHEAFVDGNRLCIIMEYAPYGDLSRALRKRQTTHKPLQEDLIWSYFIQIARGLHALHQNRILHRDIKTANVLRINPEVVKIGDLGVAKLMKSQMTHTQIGTPHYMPPEVWKNRPYSFPSDLWALGCVLYEMCTFNVPFEARSMDELRYKVLRGKYNPIPSCYSSDLQQMVRALLNPEPNLRPTLETLLSSPQIRKRQDIAPTPEPPSTASSAASTILDTIKVPKNLRLLKKRLPGPFYPDGDGSDSTAASWPRTNAETRLPPITASSAISSPGRLQTEDGSVKPGRSVETRLPKLPKNKDPAGMPSAAAQRRGVARDLRGGLEAVKEEPKPQAPAAPLVPKPPPPRAELLPPPPLPDVGGWRMGGNPRNKRVLAGIHPNVAAAAAYAHPLGSNYPPAKRPVPPSQVVPASAYGGRYY
mmetsp:Transcript_9222/g.30430  ORF Transcript_9222/g.30430 Transcript_9222/m.30430 type:complete len:490 (-) Transcript_9222:179-1648(-)